MKPKYPKGSEWRKWDLQLHTPATVLNNRFDGSNETEKWDNFISKLETSNIQAIAVTNYFCIEGYQEIIKRKERGQLSKIELILPNIEFRISQPNRQNDFINLHIIFSDAVKIEAISKFLNRLPIISTSPTGSNLYCNMDDLNKIGFERVLIEFSVLKNKLGEDFIHLKDYLTICVCRGHGSFRPESGEGRGAELAVELDKFADIIFGKRDDVAFFLDTSRHEHAVKKPVVDTSDAHCLDSVDSKFTWIKTDPTFEGLKQILYEPQDRVYIGEEPPKKIDKDRIIGSLSVSNSNDWFSDNLSVEFNENLVSVIGGKGTGKTALLDLLAYATGKNFNDFDNNSFLHKAYKELKGTILKLKWADGTEEDPAHIADKKKEETEEKTRYLSQSFVEHLCAVDKIGELREQIENVVFQKIPDEDKANYIGFADYKAAQLKIISDKKAKVVKKIEDLNRLIVGNKLFMSKKTESQSALDKIKKKDDSLKEDIKNLLTSLSSEEEKKSLEKLTALNKI